MNRKQIMKSIVFTLLLLMVLCVASFVTKRKFVDDNLETYVAGEFYEMTENSIDVFALGSSQIVYGFSAMRLYEQYGISAYGWGSSRQSLNLSYYLLQECLKTQDISLLVLDTSMLFEEPDEASFRKVIDWLPMSENKWEAIKQNCSQEGADSISSYLIPLEKYHSRWKDLKGYDFTYTLENNKAFLGQNMAYKKADVDRDIIVIDRDEVNPESMLVEQQLEYFDKIMEVCKERGISVLLIKTPKDDWNLTKSQETQKLADQYSIPFLDFNYESMMQEIQLNVSEDMKDKAHLNMVGADKLTDYLGQYIKDNYSLVDYRENGGYEPEKYQQYLETHTEKYEKWRAYEK